MTAEAEKLMAQDVGGKRTLSLSRLIKKPVLRSAIKSVKEVSYEGHIIRELENGSIEVEQGGKVINPVKPALRHLASLLNLPIVNTNGNPFNTRQLGALVIKSIEELHSKTE